MLPINSLSLSKAIAAAKKKKKPKASGAGGGGGKTAANIGQILNSVAGLIKGIKGGGGGAGKPGGGGGSSCGGGKGSCSQIRPQESTAQAGQNALNGNNSQLASAQDAADPTKSGAESGDEKNPEALADAGGVGSTGEAGGGELLAGGGDVGGGDLGGGDLGGGDLGGGDLGGGPDIASIA